MSLERNSEEIKLKKVFGFNHFRDDQWETIKRILNGERVLLIEKTGFGKSLCYQYPAAQFYGITVIFSPLIALMRDQVKFLNSIGLPTKTINSNQDDQENIRILEEAKKGKIKILYVAPERQKNYDWIEASRSLNISMVVIDEAHCISVWGHDFRPAYRRIINLIKLLPGNFPVLATTATATKRVEEDIKKQIGRDIISIRGNLMRDNFKLKVINVKNEDEKMIWLGQNIPKTEGTGLIYCGTVADTEIYSAWLQFLGINAIAYNGRLDAESRKHIEIGLIENKYKCVVSTNALGMGIDKPDIRFIYHTQVPQSPIHYYQEIGRAGRDGKTAELGLFFNSQKDLDLPKAFIEGAKPSLDKYNRIIEILKKDRLGIQGVVKEVNLKQTHVKVILEDLIDQGIINETKVGSSNKYDYKYGAPDIDTKSFEELKRLKLKELDDLISFLNTKTCRMKFLCEYLGDEDVDNCGKCDSDTKNYEIIKVDGTWLKKLAEFRETYFPLLEVETKTSSIINGRAASYYGISNVGQAIHRSKYENGGDFPEFLLNLTIKAYKKYFYKLKIDLVIFVPSTESGDLVRNFTQKFCQRLNLAFSEGLKKTRHTHPQKKFESGILKRDNINGAFVYENPGSIEGKNIMVLDDIFDSGATIKEIGRYLTGLGAEKIIPLVIAKTVGGDI